MEPQKCSYCDKPAANRCGKCIITYYCDQVCQKNHWPIHKKECKLSQKKFESFQNFGKILCKYDQMKSCNNCNLTFTPSTTFITCADKCYCSKECQNSYQTKHKKQHDRQLFITILMLQVSKYEYIKNTSTRDSEIIAQFDQVIHEVKNGATHCNKELIDPIVAQNLKPCPEKKVIIEKLLKEYEEGRRTINDDNFFSIDI